MPPFAACTARLDRLHGADASPVTLRAIPVKTGGGKVYCGFVYATLRDPTTQDSLEARVPVQVRSRAFGIWLFVSCFRAPALEFPMLLRSWIRQRLTHTARRVTRQFRLRQNTTTRTPTTS